MERKIRKIRDQVDREAKVAYNHISKWLGRGPTSVPTWMNQNALFKNELSKVKNGTQYMNLLKKYGRQFVLNPSQCRFLMATTNEKPEKIECMVKVN